MKKILPGNPETKDPEGGSGSDPASEGTLI